MTLSAGVVPVMTTIGFIGSGHIGGTLARLAVQHGYSVILSNSRGPETLVPLVAELGDAARAGTAQEAAEGGDLVVVSVPFGVYQQVPAEPLVGKLVIDTNNYYWERDGHFPAIDDGTTTSAELLQAHLTGAFVVKTFNHITSADLGTNGLPAGTPDRRALAVSGDDVAAKATTVALLDTFGYDAVDAGPLAESWRYQRDEPAYLGRFDVAGLRAALAAAVRPGQG
ncbi:NADP oxidoreductase [Actinomycetota bacterium]|nr:NADP oxidoreductase [Actinomycetota bacterium]